MRTLVAIVAAAAVLSAAFYLFASSAEEVTLSSTGGSRPFGVSGPLTETAVLFGMLVGLGLAGTRLARRA